ncbi:hypothetical protein E2562_003309 [Oryza meyeriana var. granulata]|uniref:Uncharacterized protein n=1 Tax=Oryza meyeriana var. granulata TaxID=110450 RepID=A0A6G1EF98_9ORYZ|nr:hypothetical protein E2562_003309 [Oryza meyeriana var. granulata]
MKVPMITIDLSRGGAKSRTTAGGPLLAGGLRLRVAKEFVSVLEKEKESEWTALRRGSTFLAALISLSSRVPLASTVPGRALPPDFLSSSTPSRATLSAGGRD